MTAVPWQRYVLFFSLAIGGCAVDLATKDWVFSRYGSPREHPPVWFIDEIFGLETHLNEGALFGIGQGRTSLFASLSIVAAAGVLYWLFVAGAARDRLLTGVLGLVSGGIAGNLYDRLGLPGLLWRPAYCPAPHEVGDPVYAVRDFFHFKIDAINFDWAIFNVADALLVCGAGLLVLHALRTPKEKPTTS